MKSTEVAKIVLEDKWNGAEGTHNDKPLLIRFRPGFRTVTDISGYCMRLDIVWPFTQPDQSGLPGPEELEALEEFENHLVAAYEHDCHAVLTAVITNDGARQWFFYTSDVDECGRRLSEMPQKEEPYPIELTAEEDPDWIFLRENILAGCTDDSAGS